MIIMQEKFHEHREVNKMKNLMNDEVKINESIKIIEENQVHVKDRSNTMQ